MTLTYIGEDRDHCVCPGLVTRQAAVHSSILLLHVSNDKYSIRSHSMSVKHKHTIQSIHCILSKERKNEEVSLLK